MQQVIRTVKNWWLFVLFGIIFLVTGIWMLFTPLSSFLSLAILFSILILANGVSHLIFTISNWDHIDGRGWYLASAIMELVIGLILFVYPGITLITLPFIVGFWLIFRSVFVISAAFEMRNIGASDWGWLLLGGIILLLFSACVILNPLVGAVYLVIITAIAIIMMGIAYTILGLRLRKVKGDTLDRIKQFRDAFRQKASDILKDTKGHGGSFSA
ncbi:MAG: DUF308 domain-containing protein [Filimonas sp.]|nr:DUF308 domain-containing protein [Filimonas sp.]